LFSKAIVRTPCRNFINGLTSANLGVAIYEKALSQHQKYIEALEYCRLEVIILDADEDYPDSTFIEDTAILTPHCAIITNPGAQSRRGEIVEITSVLGKYFSKIEKIVDPGTVDGGDIKMVGNHYFIGLSQRTNQNGAGQLMSILESYQMTGSVVKLKDVLHLKSGVSYLENNNLAAAGEFISKPEFQKFNILKIEKDESYAANCVWIDGTVLVAKGFPKTKKTIEESGYNIIEIDVSEFQKLDGGLSCLSLRF
jgi:dimethylargininase